MSELYDALKEYCGMDYYPFHMPGHKRKENSFGDPFLVDITEIHGFDNLHHAEGLLKEAQGRAARIFGAEESFFLVNGSTCGILSALSVCVKRGGKILMARNSHKAAYHGVFLRQLEVSYLYPQLDGKYGVNCEQSPEKIREMLINTSGIEAVMITSPTYDGVVSDVEEIARVVHSFGIPLIVDEAHGAHLGFHPYFPESAVKLGADLVIQSLHKTLPSLTQTAILHVSGDLVDREKLRKFLGVYQTSSPSYVLMASMDRCVELLENRGQELFGKFAERLDRFYEETRKLKHLHVVRREELEGRKCFRFDPSKLILSVKCCNMDGNTFARRLRERYHLEMEMETDSYVLGITSIMDSGDGFERLKRALEEIDRELQPWEESMDEGLPVNEIAVKISEAEELPKRTMALEKSCGEISGEYLYLYPPGVPLIAPGERISRKLLDSIQVYRKLGLALQGLADYRCRWIQVCEKEGKSVQNK